MTQERPFLRNTTGTKTSVPARSLAEGTSLDCSLFLRITDHAPSAQDESISCRECGAYLGQTRPQPSSDETLLFARHQFELQGKADSTEREQPPSLAAAVRAYLSSIVARSGARHLILSSSDNDEQACTVRHIPPFTTALSH